MSLATALAGLARARLVAPGDAFNDKTGTLAPVACFQRTVDNADAVPEIARLLHVYHRALAAAEISPTSKPQGGMAVGDISSVHPRRLEGRGGAAAGLITETNTNSGCYNGGFAAPPTSVVEGEDGEATAAGLAAAAAARTCEGAVPGRQVVRVLTREALRLCVARGDMAEAHADAWHAHVAAAELPLHARASVPLPWGLPGEHAARAAPRAEARLQRIIEAFSAAALPVVMHAWGDLWRRGWGGGAGESVFVIPLGSESKPAEADGDAAAAEMRCAILRRTISCHDCLWSSDRAHPLD